jgi:hypothetical protein
MLRTWFIFLFASFAVSILTLSWIQMRVARRNGWSTLWHQSLFKTYWTDISPLERVLLWCGLGAFLLTLLGATMWRMFARAA